MKKITVIAGAIIFVACKKVDSAEAHLTKVAKSPAIQIAQVEKEVEPEAIPITEQSQKNLYSIVIFEEQSKYNPADIYVNITPIFLTPEKLTNDITEEEIGKYFGSRNHGRIFKKVLKRFDTEAEAKAYIQNFQQMLTLGGQEPLSVEGITMDTITDYEYNKQFENYTE